MWAYVCVHARGKVGGHTPGVKLLMLLFSLYFRQACSRAFPSLFFPNDGKDQLKIQSPSPICGFKWSAYVCLQMSEKMPQEFLHTHAESCKGHFVSLFLTYFQVFITF